MGMKKVTCINDKNMFPGAEVIEGHEYIVLDDFMNNWGQKVYILQGIKNDGITPKGLRWYGYDATRFSTAVKDNVEINEENYILN